MTHIFKVPFATQGDKKAIPVEVQADGSLSYTQGYGYDYERDQMTDPAAKDIEREGMNGIFHDLSAAIGEVQIFGYAKWSEAGKPYPIRGLVYHKNKAWQSKVENNNIEPVAGAAWAELKADLTAGDIDTYTKGEADKKFQPLGNYQLAGYSYSKVESDTNFQPKGSYAPAGNYAMKGDSYTKAEGDGRYQAKGNYAPAADYALTTDLEKKLDKTAVTQGTGTSTTNTMSQNAITDALRNAVNIDTIYPVGVVIWFAQNKNPNNLFPGTKWSYIGENKTVRLASSSGNNVLSSGGSDNVTLTVAQLPAHGHSFSGTTSNFDYGTKWTNTAGNHTHAYNDNYVAGTVGPGGSSDRKGPRETSWAGDHTHSVWIGEHSHSFSGTTGNTGSSSSVSVVNAYVMLMGWYRTA